MNTYSRNTENFLHISIGELVIYLVIAFLIGYFVHYVFSRRRTYVKTTKAHYNIEPIQYH